MVAIDVVQQGGDDIICFWYAPRGEHSAKAMLVPGPKASVNKVEFSMGLARVQAVRHFEFMSSQASWL